MQYEVQRVSRLGEAILQFFMATTEEDEEASKLIPRIMSQVKNDDSSFLVMIKTQNSLRVPY